MRKDEISRRLFFKQAAALSAAVAAQSMWSSVKTMPAAPLTGANDRVNVALIGIGNRGEQIAMEFYNTGLCNIVALCDVDMGAPHTRTIMKHFKKASRFQDFRTLFDKMGDKIDAVVIGTPDHSHFPITMEAMAHKKHVYVEKPLARTFNEIEIMMRGEKKYNVVTQMGNQGHSDANYFQFKAWVEAGIIKDVTGITAHMNYARRWHDWDTNMKSLPPAEKVPKTLNWDIWLNIMPWHDYNHDFVNGQWRSWFNFGMGVLGDWGAHIIDTAHEFLDLGLPYEVDPILLDGHNPFFFPVASTLLFRFPKRGNMPALDLTWYDGIKNIPPLPEGFGKSAADADIPAGGGMEFTGIDLNPGKEIYSKELIFKGGSHGSTLSIIPEEKAKEMAPLLPEVPKNTSNHYANFLLSCMGKEQPRSPFAVAGPLSQVFCLGVISQFLGQKILFDRNTKQITGNPVANALLTGEPPRKGWEEYYRGMGDNE